MGIAAVILSVAAPARATVQDEQAWMQFAAVVPLNLQLRLTLEQIVRFSDRRDGLFQTQYGVLMGYRVAKGVELAFGYRRVGSHHGSTAADEDRLRQQVTVTYGPVLTRLRLDERFNPGGKEIGFRLRPLIRYNQPLRSDGLALFVSHESVLLLNSTNWGQRAGYDRMRNTIGLAFPIGKALKAEVGYLNQYRLGRGSSNGEMDHVLNMQLTINLGALARDAHRN